MTYNRRKQVVDFKFRQRMVLLCIGVIAGLLFWRAVYLQVYEQGFLESEGQRRHFSLVDIPGNRGIVVDRNGLPLAISTPIHSVYFNPRLVSMTEQQLRNLAKALKVSSSDLKKRLSLVTEKRFIYLKRRVDPKVSRLIRKMRIKGVRLKREVKRYYPLAEVSAHVVGFTNVNDIGQEGIELKYNKKLSGIKGLKRVRRNAFGGIVEDVERIKASAHGVNITLSIDQRLQYLAYRELKAAVQRHRAKSASLVMLDIKTGEILAMVNNPSFNPNDRGDYDSSYRNRAVTDPIEPGSTIKPLVIAAGLQSGLFNRYSQLNTNPGWVGLGARKVYDSKNYGILSMEEVLVKSSNVGASQVALALGRKPIWNLYQDFGFGQRTKSSLPGESAGTLRHYKNWNQVELKSLSFGYGVSMTALQLAKSYAVIANKGRDVEVTILKRTGVIKSKQLMSAKVASEVKFMLEQVVSQRGTGYLAAVPGYRVAGKTGTVRIKPKGETDYSDSKHIALFAGLAPVSNPKIAMVVVINEPQAGEYYGGQVAAPVFSKVMQGSLRLLNVAPDAMTISNSHSIVSDILVSDRR